MCPGSHHWIDLWRVWLKCPGVARAARAKEHQEHVILPILQARPRTRPALNFKDEILLGRVRCFQVSACLTPSCQDSSTN